MKECHQCQSPFKIAEQDKVFYDKISPIFNGKKYTIPEPTLCPDCRLQRRMVWRNERFFYADNCQSCQKRTITIHKNPAFPILCNQCWWANDFDAKQYGQEYDFNKPFFQQFKELRDRVPQIAIVNDNNVASTNSEYCQDFSFGKNCYFVTGSWQTEDSFYCGQASDHSKKICDCIFVQYSELAYECMDSRKLYHCAYIQNSSDCSDCFFGFDLRNCKHCLFSYNLRNKEYYIFNEPHTKEEYEKKLSEIMNGSYKTLQHVIQIWQNHLLKNGIFRDVYQSNCEASTGNQLFNCKEVFGFNAFNCEHAKFVHGSDEMIWTQDVLSAGKSELCYEGNCPDNSYLALFCLWCWQCKNVFYSDNCHHSEQLFGCISLKREKYCILNKQYSKEDYEALVPKIIEHMRQTGEWGEFFPKEIMTYGYNETIAQEYFPLTKDQAKAKGYKWRTEDKNNHQSQTYPLPDVISDTPDSVTQEVLACIDCKRNYKIQPLEFDFYQQMNLPIPRKCSHCRHSDRLKIRPPWKLFDRRCDKCQKAIQSTYSQDRKERVYCEECYLKNVYQ